MCAIEVESAVELDFGGESRVNSRASVVLESRGPVEAGGPREVGGVTVSAAEGGGEVILKGADSTFGGVAAVEMWWY